MLNALKTGDISFIIMKLMGISAKKNNHLGLFIFSCVHSEIPEAID
jgi:hypothetical protein